MPLVLIIQLDHDTLVPTAVGQQLSNPVLLRPTHYRKVGPIMKDQASKNARFVNFDIAQAAFARSQNIDHPWCDPVARSTSIGDLIAVLWELPQAPGYFQSHWFLVLPVGFQLLRPDEAAPFTEKFILGSNAKLEA